jgi:hypothetical protein
MLKEQITMMKGQMKNIISKRANKIICPFIIFSSGNKIKYSLASLLQIELQGCNSFTT